MWTEPTSRSWPEEIFCKSHVAMMPDKPEQKVVACMPVSTGMSRASGSRIRQCGACGTDVWISPATQIYVGAGARVLCLPCMNEELSRTPPEEIHLMPPSEGQLREAERELRCEA